MEQQMTTTENLAQFCESTLFQILNLKRDISMHLAAVKKQRLEHPNTEPYTISEKTIRLLSNDFHSIRELGEKISSEYFNDASDKITTLLKKLYAPVQFRREDIFGDLQTILDDLEHVVRKKAK